MPEKKSQNSENSAQHLGVRRWGDACFHPVEEEVPEGFIVDGMLIPHHEICEVIEIGKDGHRTCCHDSKHA